ncbi:hypothetical protein GGI35DRAFT_478773 [Trichoderma velutinum]
MAEPTEIGKPLLFTPSEQGNLQENDLRAYKNVEDIILTKFNGEWTVQKVTIEEWHELQLKKCKEQEEKLAKDAAKIEEDKIKATTEEDKAKADKAKAKIDKAKVKLEKSKQGIQSKFDKSMAELRNKRAKKWGTVLKQLQRLKGKLIQNKVDVEALHTMYDTDQGIPQQGRWITFPLRNNEEPVPKIEGASKGRDGTAVDITWLEHNMTYTATYYKTTCWFGKLTIEDEDEDGDSDEPTTPTVSLEPFGETQLFIAAEFIERRYQGAPHLRNYHLRDKFSPETEWAYMRIGAPFYYGQDAEKPNHRYLVYHPFLRTRHIPQRAFADNLNLTRAKSILESVAGSSNSSIAASGAAVSALVTVLGSFLADPLRPFTSKEGEAIYTHEAEIMKRRTERSLETQLRAVLEISKMTAVVSDLARKYTVSDQNQSLEQDDLVITESSKTLKELKVHIAKRKNPGSLKQGSIKSDEGTQSKRSPRPKRFVPTTTVNGSTLQKIRDAQNLQKSAHQPTGQEKNQEEIEEEIEEESSY